MLKKLTKKIRYIIELIIVKIGLLFFTSLKPKTASNIASKLALLIGKRISVNKLAYQNISRAMPQLNPQQKNDIIEGMWDNLGRIIGEFGHIAKFSPKELENYYEISEETRLSLQKMKESKKGGIIFGGHLGNWEIGPKIFLKYGLSVSTVYRPLNNPYVEKLSSSMRGVELIGKSAKGSRKIIEIIRKGGYVIILADQKVSEGEPIKFFNEEAITTTSIARMALRYDIPIIGARSVRVGKEFKFFVETTSPINFEKTNDNELDIKNLTRQINQQLENWIIQYPSQWFWVHNRWKK